MQIFNRICKTLQNLRKSGKIEALIGGIGMKVANQMLAESTDLNIDYLNWSINQANLNDCVQPQMNCVEL